jgi:hypothetical protein
MPLTSDPQCPRCLQSVALQPLWRTAPTGKWGLVLNGTFGITCPHCGAKLRVLQTPMRLVITAIFASIIGASLYFENTVRGVGTPSDRKNVVVGVFALLVILMPTLRYLAPKLAELRLLQDNEIVQFPLSNTQGRDAAASNNRIERPREP